MDRLAAFYHWRDRQALEQAVLVASQQAVDLKEIEHWSTKEGQSELFRVFTASLLKASPSG